jgi:hypothetical protein
MFPAVKPLGGDRARPPGLNFETLLWSGWLSHPGAAKPKLPAQMLPSGSSVRP